MRNRIVIIAALVCAAFALAVAGCGGGDDSSTTSSTIAGASGASGVSGAALTKDQFVQQADQICKTSNQAVDQAANQLFGGQKPTDQQVTQFTTTTLVPAIQGEIDGITALTPPAGDEDEIQAILDAVSGAVDKITADPSLVLASNNNGPFAEADQLAQAYGLKVCGQG
jgi:hypothetical protein